MPSPIVPAGLAVALAALATVARARERRTRRAVLSEVAVARERGSDRARLQYPHVDLSRCLGCGLCVAACPEEGVLQLVLGQARVVHGARCVGHGRCAAVCPVDAIALTLADVNERQDLPALADDLQALGGPGVFLAGEVTGFALVRTAVTQGASVGREVARRSALLPREPGGPHDLVIVGAGPAGLACALAAREAGLDFAVVEQAPRLGGAVASYPRRKLVMTQPMDLPLFGRLAEATYTKEHLVELWEELTARHTIPVQLGARLEAITRTRDPIGDVLTVHTTAGTLRARHVCLALGRRGSPRKLGVPGEDLSKVSYALLDAQAYAGRHVLVVGGGDSAVEAALGLAAQPGTTVTLSYRKSAFFRLKAVNERRMHEALAEGRLSAAFGTEVVEIEPERVLLSDARGAHTSLRNDEVFVFAGGEAPFELLQRCGVSFDPALRQPVELPGERGTGLVVALLGAAVIAAATAVWGLYFGDYYALDSAARIAHPDHGFLRPARGAGLALGVAAAGAVLLNLLYILRRAARRAFGSLKLWMTLHVVSGFSALTLALAHAGFEPRATTGGRALLALVALVATGAVGRYLYAFVPRAASGRELALEEVQARLAALDREWEGDHPAFRDLVRNRVAALVAQSELAPGFLARLRAVFTQGASFRRLRADLQQHGALEGVPGERLSALLELAQRSHRAALAATWLQELQALMATWRYLHRWVALLMVLLVALHIYAALRFGRLAWESTP